MMRLEKFEYDGLLPNLKRSENLNDARAVASVSLRGYNE